MPPKFRAGRWALAALVASMGATSTLEACSSFGSDSPPSTQAEAAADSASNSV